MTSESDRSDSVTGEARAPGDAPRHWTAEDVARVLRKGVGVDGSVVRRARELLGRHQSQERLANRLGYQPETISRWERNYWPVPRVVQLALVALLDPLGRTAQAGMLPGVSSYTATPRVLIEVEGVEHFKDLIVFLHSAKIAAEHVSFTKLKMRFYVSPDDSSKVFDWLRARPVAASR